jgi:hypothetical protein
LPLAYLRFKPHNDADPQLATPNTPLFYSPVIGEKYYWLGLDGAGPEFNLLILFTILVLALILR